MSYWYNVFSLTAVLAVLETIALTLLTHYVRFTGSSHAPFYLFASVGIYGGFIPFILMKILDFEGIGTVNFMWNIVTTISMILIGYYYFGDRVTPLHMISFFLGISSIVLFNLANGEMV